MTERSQRTRSQMFIRPIPITLIMLRAKPANFGTCTAHVRSRPEMSVATIVASAIATTANTLSLNLGGEEEKTICIAIFSISFPRMDMSTTAAVTMLSVLFPAVPNTNITAANWVLQHPFLPTNQLSSALQPHALLILFLSRKMITKETLHADISA